MKKIIIPILLIFLVFLIYFLSNRNNSLINYKLNNKTYKLLTAKNSSEWQKGLMFYKNKSELKGADGMIFIFPDKQIRSFWNKNTYLDLDLYWINDEEVVGKSFLPSINKSKETTTVSSPKIVNKVVEIVQ